MDHDILRKVMEVFSAENTRLKQEVESLRKELVKAKTQVDDKLLSEVFQEKPAPVQSQTPKLSPAPAEVEKHPLCCEEKRKQSQERIEYQKKYQAEYRAKKRLEKQQGVGNQ